MLLDEIADAATQGSRPIIHFVMHGSAERGIYIDASAEFLPWETLADRLRRINIATRNNLCVVSTVCSSLQAISTIHIDQPVPFYILIAPEGEVTFGFILRNTKKFYEEVFQSLDLVSAHEKCFAQGMKLFHSEKLLMISLTRVIRDRLIGKGRQVYMEGLLTQAIQDKAIANTRNQRRLARKVAKETARPTRALIDRYVSTFLLGKKVGFKIEDLIKLAREAKQNQEK